MKTDPATPRPRLPRPLQGADLLGLSRLGFDAALGVVDLVEAMHHTIASRAGIVGATPAGRPSGITGFVYGAVRGSTRVVGLGLNTLLGAVTGPAQHAQTTPRREALLAALNGVWGDHLADSGNPLAITSSLRVGGRSLDFTQPLAAQLPATASKGAQGRILVLAHGLCMSDLQWARKGHDHGAALARDAGWTPVCLHYNSGRHVSQNGRDFAALLEQLVLAWPVPVKELAILGHSMGGLVARSACQLAGAGGEVSAKAGAEAGGEAGGDSGGAGEEAGKDAGSPAWLRKLKRIVFLGTPHHGAPLERGGRLVDTLFGVSPYVRPCARLSKARSAGITDLRYGNLQDADWQGRDRHSQRHDDRVPTPLPAGVQAFVVGATTGDHVGSVRSRVVGDGLVPLASALGDHRQPALALGVPEARRLVVCSANHWDLLDRADVYGALRQWLV